MRTRWTLALVMFGLVVGNVLACGGGSAPSAGTVPMCDECTTSDQCAGAGASCAGGICTRTCAGDAQCPGGNHCVAGLCDCGTAASAGLCQACDGPGGAVCAPLLQCIGASGSVTAGTCALDCAHGETCPTGTSCSANHFCVCAPGATLCAASGNAGACGSHDCGTAVALGCSCGALDAGEVCENGNKHGNLTGGIYATAGYLSAVFDRLTFNANLQSTAPITFTSTIYGADGRCALFTYSGGFPSSVHVDMGTVTAANGATTLTATEAADYTYSRFSPVWSAPGQTIALSASGAGGLAGFSVSAVSPTPWVVSAPAPVSPPGQLVIPLSSDFAISGSGAADGSKLTVTLAFDANTLSAGNQIVCESATGPLALPVALLQKFTAGTTGVIAIRQTTAATVKGAGFVWTNLLYVTPVDPAGHPIPQMLFKLQ